jgi:hypothetical protein
VNRREVGDLAGSVGLGALTAFTVLAMVVAGGDGDVLFSDENLHAWPLGHRPAVALALARGLTATGTGVVPYVLAVLAGVVAARTVHNRTRVVEPGGHFSLPLLVGVLVDHKDSAVLGRLSLRRPFAATRKIAA